MSIERIRAFRLSYRIPLSELARALDTTKQYISDIELGIRPMSEVMRERLLGGFETVIRERVKKLSEMCDDLIALEKYLIEKAKEEP